MTQNISLEQFVEELLHDLPAIVEESGYPNIAYLVDYYGESAARVKAACKRLESSGIVMILRSTNKAYIIVPTSTDVSQISPLMLLTPLQRNLLIFLAKTSKDRGSDRLITNYSQLSRLLSCSYGGLRLCVTKLVELQFIEIPTSGLRGKQDHMTIKITQKLKDAYDAI